MLHELKINLDQLDKVVRATPWHDRAVYGAFIAQTHYYAGHTTRLLALAASRFKFTEDRLHRRFIKHATEEMSHEMLALRDLRNLGFSLDQMPQFPSTRTIYQTQYYMIEHVSPWSFWGYILALEGIAVMDGRWLYEQIAQHHGEKTASFLKVHAVEDVTHMAEAERVLEALPDDERPVVVDQIANSCYYYGSMLEQCVTHNRVRFPIEPAIATGSPGVAVRAG